MEVKIHPHAKQRMEERGATEDEVKITVKVGEKFPAKFNRTGYRRNFLYNDYWHGKYYNTKQVEVYVINEQTHWLAITVITKYF